MNNDGWQNTLVISQQLASQLTGSSLVSPFRRCVPVQFNAEVDWLAGHPCHQPAAGLPSHQVSLA